MDNHSWEMLFEWIKHWEAGAQGDERNADTIRQRAQSYNGEKALDSFLSTMAPAPAKRLPARRKKQ